MYKLKQIPEDFIVKEVFDVKTEEQGKYSYFLLRKKNYSTYKAIELVAGKLNVPLKNVGISGVKDKLAITEQLISVMNCPNKTISLKDIELKFLGKGREPVVLGSHAGNEFEIVVRNVTSAPKPISWTINYFDDQRFARKNWLIGKALVKNNFREAVELILGTKSKDYAGLLKGAKDYERVVLRHLMKYPNDLIGAIKEIPRKPLLMILHSYQSWLWNRTAVEHLKKYDCTKSDYVLGKLLFPKQKPENSEIPIVGFSTEIKEDEVGSIIERIMEEEDLVLRDFIIRQIPAVTSEGGVRSLVAEIRDMKIGELEEDELNPGKKKVRITFSLSKGSYATVVLKHLFSQP